MSPLSKARTAKQGAATMTLLEISEEYRQEEARLKERIGELRKLRRSCAPSERFRLDRRISELTALRRETRELATLLEHYYERGYYKSGKYAL